jgi:hypothetical protein
MLVNKYQFTSAKMLHIVTNANNIIPVVYADTLASRLIVIANLALMVWGVFETYALLFGSKWWTYFMGPISDMLFSPTGVSTIFLIIGLSIGFLTAKIFEEMCDKFNQKIKSLKAEIHEKEEQIAKMQKIIDDAQIQVPENATWLSCKKTI